MKILVAVPCMDTLPVAFVQSLVRMECPKNTDMNVRFLSGSLIYDARNLLSLEAIRDEYDYVLWLDSDITFPRDILTRFLEVAIERNASFITGVYVKKTFPTVPVIYDIIHQPELNDSGHMVKQIHEYTDYPKNDVFFVQGCGFGCCFTSVQLLKKVWDTYGPAFNPLPWAGEDVSFCYRVRSMEEPILCDSRISCGHIGTFLYTEQMLKGGDTR